MLAGIGNAQPLTPTFFCIRRAFFLIITPRLPNNRHPGLAWPLFHFFPRISSTEISTHQMQTTAAFPATPESGSTTSHNSTPSSTKTSTSEIWRNLPFTYGSCLSMMEATSLPSTDSLSKAAALLSQRTSGYTSFGTMTESSSNLFPNTSPRTHSGRSISLLSNQLLPKCFLN